MRTTFSVYVSIYVSLFTLALLCAAQNSTTYPECIQPSCSPLRDTASSECSYDFSGQVATEEQTTCICSIKGIDTLLSQCIDCIKLDSNLTGLADSYASICQEYRATALPGNSTTTSTSSSNSSTAKTSATVSATTTETSRTSMTTSNPTSTTQAPTSSTGTGGGNSNVPGIALAVVLVAAQAGLL